MVPASGAHPPFSSTQGLHWGQPGQAHVSQDPLEASALAVQHPPLPPVPGWAGVKPAPKQGTEESPGGTQKPEAGAQPGP